MSRKDRLYNWWKRQPRTVRKPFVFVFGLVLVITAPLVGWIPGPGGLIFFLGGIAVLGSEFDWALSLKAFFLETLPKKVRQRWQPTPRWETAFDTTALILLSAAGIFAYNNWLAPVFSLGIGGICLFMFNRNRLTRLKKYLRRT